MQKSYDACPINDVSTIVHADHVIDGTDSEENNGIDDDNDDNDSLALVLLADQMTRIIIIIMMMIMFIMMKLMNNTIPEMMILCIQMNYLMTITSNLISFSTMIPMLLMTLLQKMLFTIKDFSLPMGAIQFVMLLIMIVWNVYLDMFYLTRLLSA